MKLQFASLAFILVSISCAPYAKTEREPATSVSKQKCKRVRGNTEPNHGPSTASTVPSCTGNSCPPIGAPPPSKKRKPNQEKPASVVNFNANKVPPVHQEECKDVKGCAPKAVYGYAPVVAPTQYNREEQPAATTLAKQEPPRTEVKVVQEQVEAVAVKGQQPKVVEEQVEAVVVKEQPRVQEQPRQPEVGLVQEQQRPAPPAPPRRLHPAEQVIRSNDVVMFGKENCQFCTQAKGIFNDHSIRFLYVDVERDPNAGAIQDYLRKNTDRTTVPNIFIRGTNIGGYTELEKLERQHKL